MTEVCFVLAPGQNHFFVEVAEAMRHELEQLGVPAELSRDGFPPLRDDLAYVLVPPHEFRGLAPPEHWPTARQLERTIFYCFEQPGTKFFDEDVRMAQGPVGAVLDVNELGVAAFRERGVAAYRAPLGWTAAWTFAEPRADDSPRARDVDLLHLGIYSDRRGRALAASAAALARRRTALVLGDDNRPNADRRPNFLLGRDKWDLLARSRVLLNIHVGERPYFEWLRVVQAICNGVLVVSEHSLDTDPLTAGEHFAMGAAEDLVALAEPYLDDEPKRAAAARAAYELLRERLPLRSSAELLAELAERVASRSRGASDRGAPPVDWPDNSGIRSEVRAAAAAVAPPPAPPRPPFDAADGEVVLIPGAGSEPLPAGREALRAALAEDPGAAFAWGLAVDDGDPPALQDVFPWRALDLRGPVLWRAAALRELGHPADGAGVTREPALEGGGDGAGRELLARAAARGMRGVHVPQIVAFPRAEAGAP